MILLLLTVLAASMILLLTASLSNSFIDVLRKMGNIFRKCYLWVSPKKKPVVSIIDLHGFIGMYGTQNININSKKNDIDKAFSHKNLETVLLNINSPGGSPVQSDLVASYIQDKAKRMNIKVISFVEDRAASGGYWLACAGQEIYAARSSIVGSIGVISSGFGFNELINKYGIENRTYTSGENKAILDPFAPAKEKHVEILKTMLSDIHSHFIDHVKQSRGSKLKGEDELLFSGEFWTGGRALELGLIDGLDSMESYISRVYGNEVRVERKKSYWLVRMFGVGSSLVQLLVNWMDFNQ